MAPDPPQGLGQPLRLRAGIDQLQRVEASRQLQLVVVHMLCVPGQPGDRNNPFPLLGRLHHGARAAVGDEDR